MEQIYIRVRNVSAALASLLIVCAVATPAAGETITLSWNENPELSVIGYLLHVGTQSGSYTQHIDVGMSTTYGWPGATPGQRYCFAVSAYVAGHLEGPKSSEVCGYSNAYPVLEDPGARSATVGQSTSLQLQGNDPDGQPVSYSHGGLPPGLTLMSSTGYISGTPTTAGTYTTTVMVSDGVLSAQQTFTWTITGTGGGSDDGSGSGDTGGNGNGKGNGNGNGGSGGSGGSDDGSGGSGGSEGSGGLRGEYYSGTSLGTFVTARTDSTVNYTWTGSPVTNVPSDHFSVRWTGEVTAPVSGTYRFSTVSDDGVRLWIGNQLIIDNWTDHAAVTNTSGGLWLQAGQRYAVRLEFFDNAGNAVIQLKWTPPGQTSQIIPQSALVPATNISGLRGEYYSGTFSSLLTTRVDPTVDFLWDLDEPAAGVPADNFSVRWTGTVTAPVTGTYYFSTLSDDGVRLWINDQRVISNWTDHGTTTDTSAGVYLQAGENYAIKLEYFEAFLWATIRLRWSYPGQSTQVIPQSVLLPD